MSKGGVGHKFGGENKFKAQAPQAWYLLPENVECIQVARSHMADEFAKSLGPTLEAYRDKGMPQRAMVEELNRLGVTAPRGGQWSLIQLQRVLKRLAA